MRGIAIIDICGTLFDSNTTFDFIRWFDPRGHRLKRKLSKTWAAKAINKMTLSLMGIDIIRNWWVKELRGIGKDDLTIKAASFYDAFLEERKILEVHGLIDQYRRQGYRLVFVSATLDFIADVVAEKLDVGEVYSTRLDYRGGICLGTILRDLLGKKKDIVRQLVEGYDEIVAITDNKSDYPFLELSGGGYIVSDQKSLPFWKSKNLEGKFKFILTGQ